MFSRPSSVGILIARQVRSQPQAGLANQTAPTTPTTHTTPQNLARSNVTHCRCSLCCTDQFATSRRQSPSLECPIRLSISPPAMSSMALFRVASRSASAGFFRASAYSARSRVPQCVAPAVKSFSTTAKLSSGAHEEETFEEFSAR